MKFKLNKIYIIFNLVEYPNYYNIFKSAKNCMLVGGFLTDCLNKSMNSSKKYKASILSLDNQSVVHVLNLRIN